MKRIDETFMLKAVKGSCKNELKKLSHYKKEKKRKDGTQKAKMSQKKTCLSNQKGTKMHTEQAVADRTVKNLPVGFVGMGGVWKQTVWSNHREQQVNWVRLIKTAKHGGHDESSADPSNKW